MYKMYSDGIVVEMYKMYKMCIICGTNSFQNFEFRCFFSSPTIDAKHVGVYLTIVFSPWVRFSCSLFGRSPLTIRSALVGSRVRGFESHAETDHLVVCVLQSQVVE